MPIDKTTVRKGLRFGVLVACLGLEGSLVWYDWFGGAGAANNVVLSLASLVLLLGLVVTGILPVPAGIRIPFFGVWPNLADSIKAIAFFLAIFVWTPLAKQLVPDTPLGAIIILAPDVLFVLAALVYLSNGLSKGG